MKPVAEILVDDADEGFNLLGFEGADAGAFQDFAHVVGAQEGEIVPTLQVGVDPRGDGGKKLVERARFGVRSEGRGDELADDAGVKCVAGQAYSAVPEQVLRGAAAAADFGAGAEQGEIAGATAEVTDQEQFVVVESGFIGGSGGYRLQFKLNLLEAGEGEGFAQAGFGEFVVLFGFRADKLNGAADDGAADGALELILSLAAEVTDEAGENVFELVAAAKDLGAGKLAVGQMRLERLDEAALFVGFKVALDGGRTGQRLGSVDSGWCFELLEVEDRSKGWSFGAQERKGGELDGGVAREQRYGAVRGAEIDSNTVRLILRLRHLPIISQAPPVGQTAPAVRQTLATRSHWPFLLAIPQKRVMRQTVALNGLHQPGGARYPPPVHGVRLILSRDPSVSDFAQTVKQQADIVKVIEGYIRLRKAGAQNYSGLCPFHKEKSPSFSVHAVRQFYHCFGCQASGDVFSFVGKIENVTFPEAVRIVAQKCGIPLPKREFSSPEEAAEARLRVKLLELHETATAWFEEQLQGPEGAVAREYLAGRGMTPEGIKAFRMGYAPDSFNALRDRLSGMADNETLRASGLFSSKEQGDGSLGPIYDRFRKRVMFPIANESGRVIAFTARTLETGDKAGAKYINSPETPLYSKGSVLFNLDKAKASIRKHEFAVLVEGQMDCISVFLRGIQNVIATSGTAFTEQQVGLLKRHTSQVVVNFDPDAAGSNAAEKSIALLTEEGFTIKIVTLEGGLDPDRFIRERGVEAYMGALRGARRQADYLIERARTAFPGASAEQKVKAMNFLLPHIRRMPEKLARDQFAADASQKLNIDSAVLREELRQAALRRRDHIEARGVALTEVERVLLRALAITDPEFERGRRLAAQALTEQPAWFEHLGTFTAMQALINRQANDPMEVVEDEAQRALLAEALLAEVKPPEENEILGAIQEIQERAMGHRLRELRELIAEAERRGDFAELAVLTQQKLELDRALRNLHNQRPPEA